eukprot:RCo038452
MTAATRGPPCQCRPPRYHRGGQSAREGQELRHGALACTRWTLRGRRAEISSSTLQQLQVLSLSLQSALHISVALLVQYRFPSGWRGSLRDTPEAQAAGSSSPTQEEAASREEHPVEAYHGESKCVPRGISSSVWLCRALPCSCTATLSPEGEEGSVVGPRDSCIQALHRQRVEDVHEGRDQRTRPPCGKQGPTPLLGSRLAGAKHLSVLTVLSPLLRKTQWSSLPLPTDMLKLGRSLSDAVRKYRCTNTPPVAESTLFWDTHAAFRLRGGGEGVRPPSPRTPPRGSSRGFPLSARYPSHSPGIRRRGEESTPLRRAQKVGPSRRIFLQQGVLHKGGRESQRTTPRGHLYPPAGVWPHPRLQFSLHHRAVPSLRHGKALSPRGERRACRLRSKPVLLHVSASRDTAIQQTISESAPFFFTLETKASA